jgi:hypothetical protein
MVSMKMKKKKGTRTHCLIIDLQLYCSDHQPEEAQIPMRDETWTIR